LKNRDNKEMNKMRNNVIPISLLVIGIFISIVKYPSLPERMPIHWTNGVLDGELNKNFVLFLFPTIMVITMVITVMQRRLSKTVKKNIKMLNDISNYVVLFLFIFHIVIVSIGLGLDISVDFVVGLMLGIFIILISNSAQRTKQNYMYGLRTKWTLKNEKVWVKANRLASRIFVFIGFVGILSAFFVPEHSILIILLLLLLGGAVSVYASFIMYKKITNS
jgi:uncharacterized membrane protein